MADELKTPLAGLATVTASCGTLDKSTWTVAAFGGDKTGASVWDGLRPAEAILTLGRLIMSLAVGELAASTGVESGAAGSGRILTVGELSTPLAST
jgi:hypothetical protein